MTTALFLGTSVALLLLSLAANAFFLHLGARWAMIPNASFGRAVWATVAVALLDLILLVPLGRIHLFSVGGALLLLVLEMLLSLALTWLIIARIFKTSLPAALVAWLPTLIPAA
jgi:hypothetical protein